MQGDCNRADLVPQRSTPNAATLLPAMTDVKEDIGLQKGLLVEDRVWRFKHGLPAQIKYFILLCNRKSGLHVLI